MAYKDRWNTGSEDGDLRAKVSVALQVIAKDVVDASSDWDAEPPQKRALVAAVLTDIDGVGQQVTRIIASNSDLNGTDSDNAIKTAITSNLGVLMAAYQ